MKIVDFINFYNPNIINPYIILLPKNHPGFKSLGNLETCGRSFVTQRIVGGKKAELGQYPWLVNIGYSVPGGGVEYKCGGSLIGPRHILTAAHCVAGLPKSYNLYG